MLAYQEIKTNINYQIQQREIKKACDELDLIVFYPNYHADKTDKCTVLIYTKENHNFNNKLPYYASNDEYKSYICSFENSDINGNFDFNFMNHGKLDLRKYNSEKTVIKDYIVSNIK